MSYPYSAVASIKFKSPPGAPAFSFNKGDKVTVLAQADEDGDWLEGETDGGKGVFPASFVERIEEEQEKQEDQGETVAEPVKAEEGTEAEAPLAAAVKQGVEKQEGDFPSDDTISADKEEDKSASQSSAEIEAPPAPPLANPTSPPALSSGAETITDEPRPTAVSPTPSASAATSSSAGPPAPAKKPSGLASRLAFFQQEAEKSKGPAPPPKPKPSGGGWKRPAAPATAAAPPPPAPAPAPASSPPPSATSPEIQRTVSSESAEGAGFSAADAQDSISRGGGSLKDRIAALSGGFKAEQLQPSAAPGRAPKPWKKPQPVEEEETEKQEKDEEGEQETEVKDSRPAEEETTAQSPGAEVPPFEPAEASTAEQQEEEERHEHVEPAKEAVAEPLKDDDDEDFGTSPERQHEPMSSPSASATEETSVSAPASAANAEEEDDEQAKRSALAARMAGLGGQPMGGIIMPALPKRAAGPRRGKSRPVASSAAPAEEKREEEAVEEKKEEQEEKDAKPDVLASMGGASSLLARKDNDDEDDRPKAPVDDEDFDSAAPPPPSAATRQRVYEDLPTEEGETIMDEEELAQRVDPRGGQTIIQEAIDKLPSNDGVRDLEVVPPETRELEGRNDLAEETAPAASSAADVDEEDADEQKAPLAKAVAQELERTDEEYDVDQQNAEQEKPALPPSRPPPPPTRPVDPPTSVADEAGQEEDGGEQDKQPAPPPLPKGRPPIPPSFVRQPTANSDLVNLDKAKEEETNDEQGDFIRPPIPTHPPAENNPPVITPAEAAFIASQPEILSPPEEAMDESTSGVDLDAPSVSQIAEGHEELDVELALSDKPHVKDSREEGVQTPAFDQSPPALLPASQKPVRSGSMTGGAAGQGENLGLAAVLAKKAIDEGKREEAFRLSQPPAGRGAAEADKQEDEGAAIEEEGEEEGDEEEEEEEEEEEDPEVARRRALAARMAKLGGRGMGPMFGAGFGGLPPAPPAKKKTIKKKQPKVEEEQVEQQLSEQVEEQVVESRSGSEPPAEDGHPPRRVGGIPQGGFALPGIVPPRPREPSPEPELEQEEQYVQPAADDDVPSIERGVPQEQYDDVEKREQQDYGAEADQAPPPLPPNRPAGGPPRRSVPVPAPEPEEQQEAEQYEGYDQEQAQHASHLVAEPEQHDYPHEQEEVDDDEMPAPPPPPRPAGGHQSSLPQSPPLRGAPLSPQFSEGQDLTRSTTQSSRRSSSFLSGAAEKLGFHGSSTLSPRQSMDADSRFDAERVQGGPVAAPGGGSFAASDIDLDTAGVPWWREDGLPRSLQGRGDVLIDVSESTSTKRGKTQIEKEVEVVHHDYSKTLITASFTADDTAEATTSIQQSHFPPPSKANLDSLLQWSASLGAQVFAAAHTLKSSSSTRGMSDVQLVQQCFAKATEPLPPMGGSYGVKVFEAVVEQGKKGALIAEDDEPRAGDIAVIAAKFKHALTSKTVGSDQQPHLAIVGGYESKKGKLRVVEVNSKNGNVDEESYKVEDMKAGRVTVFRVAPRDYV
ncbi:hypothetical protein JCM11251_006350 [Rhodosporidiobolus azoricus]